MTAGFTSGFDIQPVKGSRRDVVQIVSFGGESGVMTAGVWCPEHDLRKTIVHPLTEVDPVTGEVNHQSLKTNLDCIDDVRYDV